MSKALGMSKTGALRRVTMNLMAHWALNDYDPLAAERVEQAAKRIALETYTSKADLNEWIEAAKDAFNSWFTTYRRFHLNWPETHAVRGVIHRLYQRDEYLDPIFVEDCIFEAVQQTEVPDQDLTTWVNKAEKAFDNMGSE
jgi:hypothetical protein